MVDGFVLESEIFAVLIVELCVEQSNSAVAGD